MRGCGYSSMVCGNIVSEVGFDYGGFNGVQLRFRYWSCRGGEGRPTNHHCCVLFLHWSLQDE